jgi:hypothetical protein
MIWDGLAFRQVPPDEAVRLESEDKCQNLSARFISGTELKYRHQFTGYLTRELRAASTPVAVVTVKSDDWKRHRGAASMHLKKKVNMTSRADTINYMEKHLGLVTT